MNYKDNISRRKQIEQKAAKEKLTNEEKGWLYTNPVFNPKFDFPCLQRDIIDIPTKQEIIVTVSVLRYGENSKIYRPVISVVGKGKLVVDNELFDHNMRRMTTKETKVLIPLFLKSDTVSFKAFLESGMLSLAYQCEYYNTLTNVHMCETSDGANLAYGMIKKEMSDGNIVYFCKSPTSAEFGEQDFSFGVDWKKFFD